MGLTDVQFIETTKWFPNKKDNLTVQKRRREEYKVRLTWSNGSFPASAPIVIRKIVSLACCPRFSLSGHVSKPGSGLHERLCRERDGAHVSKNEKTGVFFTFASPAPSIKPLALQILRFCG